MELDAERGRRSEGGRVLWRGAGRPAPTPDETCTDEDVRYRASPRRDGANGDDGEPGRGTGDPQEAGVLNLTPEESRERLRRRARFLRELAEARELRERVTPHRARRKQIHAALRRRTFRFLG
ncbi:hypothetical protein DZF91_05670 [Actinomadura logoneensis]|uniref:Uncharacterized protein n=1 Tax=Actinomadura logoneensis TaxID=2293572 RepID=A0A372JRG4_9ACTN|nr:hypothetical protein DZF91_05670 [Actinomadura logoneensis]